jgi:hypothetical protein
MNGPIGARVVRHGRYVLCQITEVAVPKDVVRDDWNTGRPVASGEPGRYATIHAISECIWGMSAKKAERLRRRI